MLIRRRKSVAAEIDWLGRGASMSAADYRQMALAKQTERDLQRDALRWFRRMLPAGSRIAAFVNQRALAHLTEDQRRKALQALVADGMEPGACDLHFMWDARLGAPGSRGVAYVEFKRPVGAKPPTAEQIAFIADLRAMGHVAGVAKSLEAAEDLLIEAGAPLMARLPRRGASPEGYPSMERASQNHGNRGAAVAEMKRPVGAAQQAAQRPMRPAPPAPDMERAPATAIASAPRAKEKGPSR